MSSGLVPRSLPGLLLAVLLFCLLPAAYAQEIEVGARLDSLPVGTTTYQNVQVRSISIRTVMITHSGGMASIKLRDLSPEWQARFRYSAQAEAAADEAARNAPPAPVAAPVRRAKPAAVKGQSRMDALLLKFGQPAVVQPAGVDLRPKFFELELGVKSQGFRPSCAVFAVVSALEFQNAELAGHVQKFSEEYLIWAVRKSTRRLPPPGSLAADKSDDEYRDEGFALSEVVAALRAYGIPLQASMPNTFGSRIDAIEEPAPAIVEEARNHQQVSIQPLPGRDRVTLINNLVQALNAGMPVPVGMNWPATRVVNGYISTHKGAPNLGHAVTIVGYKSATGRIEDAYFIFKNSWGPRWGQGGYGTVTYGYLSNYLNDAILLELQPPAGVRH